MFENIFKSTFGWLGLQLHYFFIFFCLFFSLVNILVEYVLQQQKKSCLIKCYLMFLCNYEIY